MAPQLSVTDGAAGLQVLNLRKSYRKKTVIRDVSLTLGRGEVVALLGPNGSGKTTTFYSIAGLISPEGASLRIEQVQPAALGADPNTFPWPKPALEKYLNIVVA